MSKIKLSKDFIRNTVKRALNEDLYPSGDITSSLVKNNKIIKVKIISNENAIVGGLLFAKQAFNLVDNKIKFQIKKQDGSNVKKGSLIATIEGNARNILIAERIALNFLSHISGIATKTNKFVKLAGKKCKICCTRKTIPNTRVIQKYAVKLGGGTNHRFNLSDEFLIKDNHIASSNVKNLVLLAIKNKKGRKITVEVDNLKQLNEIMGLKFNTVLFDNMSVKNLKAGIKIVKKYYETEASGNINLKTVKRVAKTGVNRISIGSITHSAAAIDFKLEI
ncbi:carboxylating nicotinate-nucleotide diphosphorylase [Candidatus Pelagibacter sp.]|uniref:carboxylating nicotinate-nucleotide diphosphorylase n=1 Tax=uncultured Candidatus Pelagibacter sp. TaxID=372654 RepID=UPI00237353BE|nr:carboxylating nicotinate-nucleotide diphosphorylase [uncultured Candidatus Pelagibacter sp.]MDC0428067.1 carboxylating nicotinate-nucleotide diphosphorylase [Candidatus Pelagibacter sp.]MDC1003467.1 carboxylating nicotinate-nucleotide diphosphorylase [Candidatus Pelagibacter sp.]